MSGQRHPYAGHPTAAVLADHRAPLLREPTALARCDCGWIGPDCDHPAHLTEMLDRAGLLTPGTPPETPTARVLAERAAPPPIPPPLKPGEEPREGIDY